MKFAADVLIAMAILVTASYPLLAQTPPPTGGLKATWDTGTVTPTGGLQAPWDGNQKSDKKTRLAPCADRRVRAVSSCSATIR